jgi:hypothetical protein
MPTAQRNAILDSFVTALRAIAGGTNYFYSVNPAAVSRVLRSVDQASVFPALYVTEGTESRRWQTVGPQLLSNTLEIVIWGYAKADAAVAPDASHAKEALIHDVDVALAAAFNGGLLDESVVDLAPSGSAITIETDEGLAAMLAVPDIGVFRMRVPVLYRLQWGLA